MWVLLAGSLLGSPLQAQDRGAPRFGPAVSGDTIEAEASDAGRIWSLTDPPFDRFERRYEMEADSAWATHLRRGLLRLPECTAALVSARGLALTTARCVRRYVGAEQEGGALVADRPAEERSLSGLRADRLVRATEVTAEVRAVRQDTTLQAALQSVQERCQEEAGEGHRVEVESAAGKPPYTAYTYRRYEDVRVAFLPSRSVSDFGGIDGAMTYPRQRLDLALIRVYTSDGRPLTAGHFFEPPTQGVRPGDAVFAAGPSSETRRAESVAQITLRRDLILPTRQSRVETWIEATRADLDTAAGDAAQSQALHEAERDVKRTNARLEALQNDYVMSRLQRREAQFQRALRRDSVLDGRFGGVVDSLAVLQEEKKDLASAYRAFGNWGPEAYGSSTFRRMLPAPRQANSESGAVERWDSGREGVSAKDWGRRSPSVETALLAARLEILQNYLRSDTTALRRLFGEQSPAERAAAIVEESVLGHSGSDPAEAERPEVPDDDPAASVLDVVEPRARSFYERWGALTRAERQLTRRLARARQATRSAPVLPGGREPRLTDGRVLGYPYNGTMAPPFTTFFGLYEQSHAFGEAGPWSLPERWHRSAAEMDRSVPLNVAASTDGVVSTRGAPLLNKYLEIVGVTMGPNIQGSAGTYIFLPERMRTVAVDVRGLRHALRQVYEAEGLVDELFGGASESTNDR